MKPEQALTIIKEALDHAVATGAYKNLDYINVIINSYNLVFETINPKKVKDEEISK